MNSALAVSQQGMGQVKPTGPDPPQSGSNGEVPAPPAAQAEGSAARAQPDVGQFLTVAAQSAQQFKKASIKQSKAVSGRRRTLHNRVLATMGDNLGFNIILYTSTGKQQAAYELALDGPTLNILQEKHPHLPVVLEQLFNSLSCHNLQEAEETFRQLAIAQAAVMRWRLASITGDAASGSPNGGLVNEALANRGELLDQHLRPVHVVAPTPRRRRVAKRAVSARKQQGAQAASTTSVASHAAGDQGEQCMEQAAATSATQSQGVGATSGASEPCQQQQPQQAAPATPGPSGVQNMTVQVATLAMASTGRPSRTRRVPNWIARDFHVDGSTSTGKSTTYSEPDTLLCACVVCVL